MTEALGALRRTDLDLTNAEWAGLKQLVEVLGPFEEVTTSLCSQFYASISKVIPAVRLLQLHLQSLKPFHSALPGIEKLVNDLHVNVTNRFKDIEKTHTTAIISTFLDPR